MENWDMFPTLGLRFPPLYVSPFFLGLFLHPSPSSEPLSTPWVVTLKYICYG